MKSILWVKGLYPVEEKVICCAAWAGTRGTLAKEPLAHVGNIMYFHETLHCSPG